jgi:thiaminase/transcriptional activator TenA
MTAAPAGGPGGFTGRCWRAAEPVYRAVLEHPFLRELAAGTLDPAAFAFYVSQDARYLHGYAQTLAALAARAPDEAATATFARHAAGAIEVERQLHAGLLAELGIDPARARRAPLAPTTLAYLSYLRATVAFDAYLVAAAAVLPCYWIYQRVGERLAAAGSPDPRYQRWIDTYADPAFAALVQEALAAVDRAAAAAGAGERARAAAAFATTARYEWMFWEMAYRQERWPVG